ncbi:DEAD/DEAH box helicase [Desulforhabdus amnigena]|uniref:Helicase n=1 Tax=Desulforhabdus amnigena TaxID=40218 RepID=A0A9W6FX75_9BACT|nr:DEAD/DEAH box helicase [Desulforhabdus amnigena]GLI36487.1 helicase [Desulforhabdus amnigena]
MAIIRRQKRNRSKEYPPQEESLSLSRKEQPRFEFKIHRSLRPVLERIKVPEPQPFVPDPFQTEALETLEESDVLTTAPTGAGKTYIAVKAIEKVFQKGGKSWYASPLKALSNAKYEEFSDIFGPENVGILTGDRKENAQAPIIVGTTEILRNQLYDTMHMGEDIQVDLVVLDEAHYLGDRDRGVVWEEVLIYLPPRVRLLLLSATIQNAREICDWLEWLRKAPCKWVAAFERPVPLFPLYLFPSGELTPLGTRRGLFAKIRTVDRRSFSRSDFPNIPKVMEVLRQADLLPAIFFLKSRADCEKAISLCRPVPALRKGRSRESDPFYKRLDALLEKYPFLRRHQHLSILKNARVGAHHGGQLPHWKLLLEKLMQDGYLEAIFSTSTVAAGVNFPARTVVVFQSDRFNGKEFVQLSATDLLQMTGRAGRRGMDEIGFALVVPGPFQDPQLVHDLFKSPPDPIISQIRVNHSMVLNLLLSHEPREIRSLFASSLATYQNLSSEIQITQDFKKAEQEMEEWIPDMACGSLDRLAEVRPQFALLNEELKKTRKIWKRQASLDSLCGLMIPGRIFLSRRGTPYIAVDDPDTERESVEAVRMAVPLRLRRGQVRTYQVGFHRVHHLGEKLDRLPPLRARKEWEALAEEFAREPFRLMSRKSAGEESPSLEAVNREMASLIQLKAKLPCNHCVLFGPCQKNTSHPFASALQRYLSYQAQMHSIQDQLWQSFLQHLSLLQEEGYVNSEGHLTDDGLWASKLRLDQPLLISDCIRKGVFPSDQPELLAALIAPFVMDRERPGDIQLSTLVWKYPDLAAPFFKMLKSLQPLREHLQAEGFPIPPLPFWAVITAYHWALGHTWEEVREISSMDEGDLAMVILRTAEHLRQIESLTDTHPRLAASARRAIDLILREPVLVA